MSLSRWSSACAIVAAWALASCNGWQHEGVALAPGTGDVAVDVTDAEGTPLAGARVTGAGKSARTDTRGRARLTGLAEGGLLLQVAAAGHASAVLPAVVRGLRPATVQASLSLADEAERRLLFTGELSLDGGLEDPNRDGIGSDAILPRGRGAGAAAVGLFDGVRPFFHAFDLVTATLETVLGDGQTPHPLKRDRALAPPEVAPALPGAGIAVVNLGTGHAYDFLDAGIDQTLAALSRAGVPALGAGRELAEAARPALSELPGLRVGQVSLSALVGHVGGKIGDLTPTFEARADKAGVVEATRASVDLAVAGLRAPNAAPAADLVVAHIAAGDDWSDDGLALAPLAEAATAAGAALVLGHGPRPVGPLALVHGALVSASLGQLVFGGNRPEARRAVLLEAVARGGRLARARLWPVGLLAYRPFLATGALAARTVRKVAALSTPGVAVFPWRGQGVIALDAAATTDEAARATVSLRDDGEGGRLSEPIAIAGDDLESFVTAISAQVDGDPGAPAAVELGRELLWEGDFEDWLAAPGKGNGAGWSLGAGPDEGLTDGDHHGGQLALELVRKAGNTITSSVRGAGLYDLRAGARYTFSGCWRLDGQPGTAHVALAVVASRAWKAPVVAQLAAPAESPGEAWSCFAVELRAPAHDQLVTPWIALDPPGAGTSRLFVDDLSLIEWDEHAAGALPAAHEYERARCRAPSGTSATLAWTGRRLTAAGGQ